MASNFTANSEGMQQAASELNATRDELRNEVTQTSQMLERLTDQGFTTPRASATFQQYTKAWYQAISDLYGRLDDVARAIDETRQGIDQRDQRLTQDVTSIDGSGGSGGGPSGAAAVAGSGAITGGGAVAARSSGAGGVGSGTGGGRAGGGSVDVATPPSTSGTGSIGYQSPIANRDWQELQRHIVDCNPSRTHGNCGYGAVAFANRYRGAWDKLTTAWHAPERPRNGLLTSTLERYFGSGAEWQFFRNADTLFTIKVAHHVIAGDLSWGPGSQGILFGQSADGVGHAWNVINHRGKLYSVDTQIPSNVEFNRDALEHIVASKNYVVLGHLPIYDD